MDIFIFLFGMVIGIIIYSIFFPVIDEFFDSVKDKFK
jgi:tetrahydromethanopterin S-methyltransferase subunit G